MRTRKVGTITLGVTLILYGIGFLLHSVFSQFSYYFLFQAWPVILLGLGIEILVEALIGKKEEFKYDFAAIFIICIVVIFAFLMAGLDWLYIHDALWLHR